MQFDPPVRVDVRDAPGGPVQISVVGRNGPRTDWTTDDKLIKSIEMV
jgi:hypothetical protein